MEGRKIRKSKKMGEIQVDEKKMENKKKREGGKSKRTWSMDKDGEEENVRGSWRGRGH